MKYRIALSPNDSQPIVIETVEADMYDWAPVEYNRDAQCLTVKFFNESISRYAGPGNNQPVIERQVVAEYNVAHVVYVQSEIEGLEGAVVRVQGGA